MANGITLQAEKTMAIPIRWTGLAFVLAWLWWLLFNGFSLPCLTEARLSVGCGIACASLALLIRSRSSHAASAFSGSAMILASAAMLFATLVACLCSWGTLELGSLPVVLVFATAGLSVGTALWCWSTLLLRLKIDAMTIALLSCLGLSAALYCALDLVKPGVGEAVLLSFPVLSAVLFQLCGRVGKATVKTQYVREQIEPKQRGLCGRMAFLSLIWLGTGFVYATLVGSFGDEASLSPLGTGLAAVVFVVFLWLIFSRKTGSAIIQCVAIALLVLAGISYALDAGHLSGLLRALISGSLLAAGVFLAVVLCIDVAGTFSRDLRWSFGWVCLACVCSFSIGTGAAYIVQEALADRGSEVVAGFTFLNALCAIAVMLLLPATWIAYEISGDSIDDNVSAVAVEIMNGLSNSIAEQANGRCIFPERDTFGNDEFAERVAKMTQDYDLSPRQQEIFLYLIRGRNADYIANKLFISQNTVRTHIANIYRKFEVHTQNELMNYFYGE